MSKRWSPTKLSLRGKLLLITVSVLTLGGSTGAWLVIGSYRDSMLEAARASNDALAATVAEYSDGPLVFEDEEGAREILNKLARNSEVVRATLATNTGRVLARYEKSLRAGEPRERPALVADALVSHKGQRIGRLVLEASTTAVDRRIAVVAERIVLGSLALILLCALLALRLQHIITGPLARLAGAMRRVGQRGGLGERLEHVGDDEIGVLYERFNDMLAQLQQREKERAEAALWLRTLVDSLPDQVYVFDARGNVVEIFGVATPLRDTAPGRSIHDLVPAPAAAVVLKAIAETLASGKPVRIELEMEERYFETLLTPVEGAGTGEGRRVLAVARNATERRRLENQLFRSQKMEAVGQLAGGIAHDFNNLLAGVMGYAEVARIRDGTPARQEALDRILEICERAGDLVKQLLAFSRKGPSTRRPTDLNELVRRVHGILRRTVDPRIEIIENLAPEACTADVDPAQLESAILNLGVNARDAMPEGGTISLSTAVQTLDELAISALDSSLSPGEYVEIAVKDTGSGIPAELLPRIFEPFFTTKEAGKGTGLGLAAVYGTLASHRGSVRVHSEPGKGSDFRIFLPRVASSAPPDSRAAPPRGSGRLMLVDDEVTVRVTAAELLKGLGYSVEAFERPRDAISFFEEHHASIDAAIVDMVMPQMNGAELIRRLRQISPGVRVLVASGHLGLSDESASVVDVPIIQKPFTLTQLATAVDRLLHPAPGSPRARA